MNLALPEGFDREMFIWAAVWSYMRNPDFGDEVERRRQVRRGVASLAVLEVMAAEHNQAGHAEPFPLASLAERLKGESWDYFVPAGAFAGPIPAADEDGDPLHRRRPGARTAGWRTVGFILWVIRSMAEYHSDIRQGGGLKLGKYLAVLSRVRHGLETNEKAIESAWMRHKSVAHLCAALFLVEPYFDFAEHRQIGVFLSSAYDWQCFLETFRARSRFEPLVPIDDLWRVPAQWVDPNRRIPVPRLSDELLERLKAYPPQKSW